jgi:hypothetical protein
MGRRAFSRQTRLTPQTDRKTQRESHRHRESRADPQTDGQAARQADGHTDRQRERQTERRTDGHTDRQTHTHNHTDTQTRSPQATFSSPAQPPRLSATSCPRASFLRFSSATSGSLRDLLSTRLLPPVLPPSVPSRFPFPRLRSVLPAPNPTSRARGHMPRRPRGASAGPTEPPVLGLLLVHLLVLRIAFVPVEPPPRPKSPQRRPRKLRRRRRRRGRNGSTPCPAEVPPPEALCGTGVSAHAHHTSLLRAQAVRCPPTPGEACGSILANCKLIYYWFYP